jgi:tRNA wybutosine-synthesizing protein 3
VINIRKNKDFLDKKERALYLLKKAKSENKVDKGIQKIIDLINKSEYYYTSSSCAGRIVLIELPEIGDKRRSEFLGKWHRPIEKNELELVVKKRKTGFLWLLAQSPILHIAAATNIAADKLLKTAISCGFKNSGLKSIVGNIIVEICSTERLDAPIGKNGRLFCNDEYLCLLVDISNEVLDRADHKLKRFEYELRNSFINFRKTKN